MEELVDTENEGQCVTIGTESEVPYGDHYLRSEGPRVRELGYEPRRI